MFWRKHKGLIKNIFFFILSFSLLIYVFNYLVDWKEITSSLSSLSYIYFIPIIGFTFLAFLIENFKLWIFAKKCGDISPWKLLPIFMTGVFFNAITPGARSGGELVRSYYLQKETGADSYKCTAVAYAASATYALAFLIFAMISTVAVLFLVDIPQELSFALILVGVTAVAVAIIIYFIYWKHHLLAQNSLFDAVLKMSYWIAKRHRYDSYELYKAKVVMDFSRFVQKWAEMFTNKKMLAMSLGIDVFAILLNYIKVVFIFMALGSFVNPFIIIAVTSVANLVGFFLILPGGVGVTEASMIPLYISFGITPGLSAAVTLIDRASYYFGTYVVGGMFFAFLSIKHHVWSQVKANK